MSHLLFGNNCATMEKFNSELNRISNTLQNPDDLLGVLGGAGEMGELTRVFEWSKTPVGPMNTWPHSLITLIKTILTSRYPMWLAWGQNLTLFYNDAYAKMTLGPKHPWALGRSFREVWSEIWPEVGPRAESVLCSGQATWDEGLLLFLERNGFPEETYHTFSYSPVFGEQGHIHGILCVVTEDTERNISERRLRTLRELAAHTNEEVKSVEDACKITAHILENNPKDVPFALLYLLDVDEEQVSLAASSGIKPGEPLSPVTLELSGSEEPWPFTSVIKSGCSILISHLSAQFGPLPGGPWPEPSPQAMILPLAKPGQTQFAGFLVVGISARRPLDDAYRGFFDLVAGQVAISITNARAYEEERRRAEALAELDKAKTVFFSNVSHEFRTPLTLMLGPIEEMLKSTEQDWIENHHHLKVVYRNGLRLQRLVNTLLDFSKIEAGRIHACFEPTDIAVYTENLASNFRSVCEKAGLNLCVNCQPITQPVFLDQHMWEKIVLNLLSNAFKFTFEGEINISVCQLAQAVELRVRDTGIGIAAEEMPRLFERFHRIENSMGRTYEGSGIGLSLIHELVKLHNGSIRAESEVGYGTTFIITIPLGSAHLPREQVWNEGATATVATEAKQFVEEAQRWLPDSQNLHTFEEEWFNDNVLSSATVLAEQKNTARLLIVDDNADMRQYLMRLLMPQYKVETTSNGETALALIQNNPPDLIISDAMMPQLDGFGLLKALRADVHTANIPVIILSARAGEENRIEGMQCGADEYFVKPFSARVLLASVSAHLQMARLRQEAHEAIRESEERFRALTSTTSDVVYRMSADWSERSYLQGREFVTDMLEPSKKWIDKYIHQDDQPHVKQAIQKAIQSRDVFELEHRVIRVDGSLGWTHSRAIPILNKNGEIVEWFGTASDVSRRKEAEQALLEASRHKDEFLATLAHELRNPLVPLFNALEIMRLAKNNAHIVEKAQDIMERQVVQMDRLIEDLLDLSRISHGKIQLQIERIELSKVIQQTLENSYPIIKAAEHKLEVDLPSYPIYIKADITRLAQVFSNLLNNASKYTEKGGMIRLSAQLHHEHVVVSVLDNGVGIPTHMLSHIFNKFTQVDKQLKRSQGGLGIGLSLVKQLVELHGGTVEAKSRGENLGSEFIVRIPIVSAIVKTQDCNNESISPTNCRRILIVDDNIDITTSLTLLLEFMGHTIKTAYNGLDAIDTASSFQPDLILMDIGMPQLNGYDVAKEIRKQPWGNSIVLAALTGWSQEKDRHRAKEAGFDFHITKPIKLDMLEKLLTDIDFDTV
ncbi:sensor histidine kinase [Legionella cincinnatiensis]|uniref:histidine kinase n=2 Tax=Legionella cincinnatiensis TaxID=28085 RepID=A0A378IN66_9GAMM|nr:sensor histidine kinase [Legionella cincinnatiensis]STX36589.1 sensor histidine kinase [Legionella cincinnatiensis]